MKELSTTGTWLFRVQELSTRDSTAEDLGLESLGACNLWFRV